ncbi:MAG: pyridoxamine 5'-phosphate oxidase family protein [Candidatus Kariarchaeaceae archaeon]
MSQGIPESYRDLVDGPVYAAFTTLMPTGYPQTTVIWCNSDGRHVLINTMKGFQKERNMRRNPKVTLFAYERENPLRFIEIRGKVIEITEEGAMDHLDQLSELYVGKSPYFGELLPIELKEKETPVLCKILPTRIVVESSDQEEDE